jgi:hypothetical protein
MSGHFRNNRGRYMLLIGTLTGVGGTFAVRALIKRWVK